MFPRRESGPGDDPIQLLHNHFYIRRSFLLAFMYFVVMMVMET